MACRHLYYEEAFVPEFEWTPMAMREAICLLRRSNPEKWAGVLRNFGIEVEENDYHCMQNLDGDWEACPLCVPRGVTGKPPADVPRNEFGLPLLY